MNGIHPHTMYEKVGFFVLLSCMLNTPTATSLHTVASILFPLLKMGGGLHILQFGYWMHIDGTHGYNQWIESFLGSISLFGIL